MTIHNLNFLYKIDFIPSDTYMREVLDEVNPHDIRSGFKRLFSILQTSKKIRDYTYIDDCYLLAIDGTGFFKSKTIKCNNCCKTEHKNGTVTYHHNMVTGAIVHPNKKGVIPLCPEPIVKQDGVTKNDCEMNAVTRFLNDFRREHPHLKTTILEDALFGKAPHIRHLESLKLEYIIGVKSSDHRYLFKEVSDSKNTQTIEIIDEDNILHRYTFLNKVSLNKSNLDVKVNFMEYSQLKEGETVRYFSWITSHSISRNNVALLVKSGRSRWKIENETFNTLKNQDYHFEHNFGHGHKYLSTVLSFLMMIAFLIDQIQLIGSIKFKKALEKTKSKVSLWFKIRSLFINFFIKSWNDLFLSISNKHLGAVLTPDTS